MTTLFLSVFEISVSMSLIIAALILLTSFLNKRYAAKWKYLIWIFLALRLLVPFIGADMQTVIPMLSQMKTQTALESEETHTDTPAGVTIPSGRVIVEIPAQMTTPISMQSGNNSNSVTLLDIAAFVWMSGSLIFMSLHLISYFHYKKQVMERGSITKDTRILHQMSELQHELHIRRTIHVVEYPEADTPMIIGFLNPVLILPKEPYNSQELFFILKHELVHLKHGDVYFKLLFAASHAVHWFNPLIWIMQKEAAIDMELYCDEIVIQGTDYAVRKAYTETLLSTIHKRFIKKTDLSTQFYGGKQIMKKRFKNILLNNEKKNGMSILICTVILMLSLGTLAGCSIAKQDAEDISGQPENETSQVKPDGNSPAINHISEKTVIPASSEKETEKTDKTLLKVMREGEIDEIPATLFAGEGYSIYLTDDSWQQCASDEWLGTLDGETVLNGQVQLRISRFENKTVNQIRKELAAEGYIPHHSDMIRQESEIIYKARLNKFENDVWCVFYCYPIEAEEGWGAVLPVIVDTFSVLIDDGNIQNSELQKVNR